MLDAGWDDQSEGHVVLLGTHMLDTWSWLIVTDLLLYSLLEPLYVFWTGVLRRQALVCVFSIPSWWFLQPWSYVATIFFISPGIPCCFCLNMFLFQTWKPGLLFICVVKDQWLRYLLAFHWQWCSRCGQLLTGSLHPSQNHRPEELGVICSYKWLKSWSSWELYPLGVKSLLAGFHWISGMNSMIVVIFHRNLTVFHSTCTSFAGFWICFPLKFRQVVPAWNKPPICCKLDASCAIRLEHLVGPRMETTKSMGNWWLYNIYVWFRFANVISDFFLQLLTKKSPSWIYFGSKDVQMILNIFEFIDLILQNSV